MKHGIRFALAVGAAVSLAVSAGGCKPEQQEEAREKGAQVAETGKNAAAQAGQAARNSALAGKVEAAMKLRQGLDTGRIDVAANADTGVVKLEGSVPDTKQRRLAEEVAKSTDGVKQVQNELAVPPGK